MKRLCDVLENAEQHSEQQNRLKGLEIRVYFRYEELL